MGRYINLDEMLNRSINGNVGDLWMYDVCDLDEFVTCFDVLKIVRCGECKFSSNKNRTCLCSKSGKYMKEKDFCCYGEEETEVK